MKYNNFTTLYITLVVMKKHSISHVDENIQIKCVLIAYQLYVGY